jgi:hypothetical protein
MTRPIGMETVARWESRGGGYYVELRRMADECYGYDTRGGCGTLGQMTREDAIEKMAKLVARRGVFQPGANTSPMRRVK